VDDPARAALMSGAAAGDESPLVPAGLDAVVAFVRHGESELVAQGRFQGQADSPLTELGRRQALLAARRLARRTRRPALPLPAGAPHAIVHSPLSRAAETASLIGRAVSGGRGDAALTAPIPLLPEPGFSEIGQGDWEGLPGQEIVDRWGDTLAGWRRDPLAAWAPGGESLHEVDARVRPALRQLLAGLAIAAPVSAGPRSQVLGYADTPSDEPWSIVVGHDGVFKVTLLALLDLPLTRFWMLPFALCGITVVEIRNGRPRLRLHNATDHLADLEAPRLAATSAAEPRIPGAL
jgi:probable phosphoglycerate mutase